MKYEDIFQSILLKIQYRNLNSIDHFIAKTIKILHQFYYCCLFH